MFSKVSYRRGVIEGVILFTLGRLGALITPSIFPDWTSVVAPLIFMTLEYILAPYWATRRIAAPKRERLSKRFWLLGPLLASICFIIDLVITLSCGLPITSFLGTQLGPALPRLLNDGPNHLTMADFALYEFRTILALFAFYTMAVVCTKLSQGGFLRFTMPAGGNRVTL
ncbi:hypothetical protein KSF_040550 [Reticulibacter mediterranei]|uniref:Uncharacterized protein n=1 Tax=Reticulibacter mediterranei TaxID=2778369 RepID=A0A8J3N4E0_9CHLR|nr:hypothetical protein [Reticulibacter mediterranei]GHO94007.1 hypothetical protein KSF_040550 [Reticulibacter mediterranei]